MEALGLIQPILLLHGQENLPETYINGSRPIDAMFTSPTLTMTRGGYLPFGIGAGDHRICWGDFTYVSTLRHKSPDIVRPAWRRLKLSNPRVVTAYVGAKVKHVEAHDGHS